MISMIMVLLIAWGVISGSLLLAVIVYLVFSKTDPESEALLEVNYLEQAGSVIDTPQE